MGLPRYLTEYLTAFEESLDEDIDSALGLAFALGRIVPIPNDVKISGERCQQLMQLRCALKWHISRAKKFNYKGRPKPPWDDLDKVPIDKYVAMQEVGTERFPETLSVMVSRFIAPKLLELNRRRKAADEEEYRLKSRVALIRSRVYSSRSFPPSLKAIIFDRDGYCCQMCGKHRRLLAEEGAHLEVDHIIPWIDGGKTIYGNGQAICSECNKAKHHAKQYLYATKALGTS